MPKYYWNFRECLRQARGWSLQQWLLMSGRWAIFCRGAIPHWPFCWSAHSERSHKGTLESRVLRMRAHPWLMLLGVRLNIEVGRFPAFRALAACWNTQLTYTDTSLRPNKHLFAARKSLFLFLIFLHISVSLSVCLFAPLSLSLSAFTCISYRHLNRPRITLSTVGCNAFSVFGHAMTSTFLSDRHPLWNPSGLTSTRDMSSFCCPKQYLCHVFTSALLSSSDTNRCFVSLSWFAKYV